MVLGFVKSTAIGSNELGWEEPSISCSEHESLQHPEMNDIVKEDNSSTLAWPEFQVSLRMLIFNGKTPTSRIETVKSTVLKEQLYTKEELNEK